MRIWLFVLIGLGGFVSLPTMSAHANSDSLCKQWFQKKKYIEASRCFYSLAQQKISQKKITAEHRESIGAWLQNAILSLRKAANQTRSTDNASYLREQAIKYIDLYLKKKFFETDTQRRAASVQRTSLYDKVGYATLTVTTSNTKNQIKITGFRFAKQSKGSWSQTVRPGNYTILVTDTNGVAKAKVVAVKPGQPQVINLNLSHSTDPLGQGTKLTQPTPPPSDISAATWSFIFGGSAVGVVGIVLAATGLGARARANELNRKFKKGNGNANDTQALVKEQNSANRQIATAWVLGSVGIAAITVGIIFYVAKKPNTSPPQSASTFGPPASIFYLVKKPNTSTASYDKPLLPSSSPPARSDFRIAP